MSRYFWVSIESSCSLRRFSIPLNDQLEPRSTVEVTAVSPDGTRKDFTATVRIDTPVEMDYYRNGGILQTVLRKLLQS